MFVGRSKQSITTETTKSKTTTANTTASARRTPRVSQWLAPVSCTLLLLSAQLGHVAWGMSIDRLAVERNELQQTPPATAASAATDDVLVDDMRLTAVSAGQDTDMYMLVPASVAAGVQHIEQAVNQNSIEHGSASNVDGGEPADEDAATDGGPQSDMLMLESDNTPLMQVMELPSYINVATEATEQQSTADDDSENERKTAEKLSYAGTETIEEQPQTADTEPLKYTRPVAALSVEQPQQPDVENEAEFVPQILATIETDAEADVAATTDASITSADDGEANSSAEKQGIEQTTEQKQTISSQEAQVENAANVAEAATEATQPDLDSTTDAAITMDEHVAEAVTESIEEAVEPPNAEIAARPIERMQAEAASAEHSNAVEAAAATESPNIVSNDEADRDVELAAERTTELPVQADHDDAADAAKDDFADMQQAAIQESAQISADNTKAETIFGQSPIEDISNQAQAEQMPVLVAAERDEALATELATAQPPAPEPIEQATADASLQITHEQDLDKTVSTDMQISKQQVVDDEVETELTQSQRPAEQVEMQHPAAVISAQIQMDDVDLQKTQQQQQLPETIVTATHDNGISILSTILQAPLGSSPASSTASHTISIPNYLNTTHNTQLQQQQQPNAQPHADNEAVKTTPELFNSHLRRYDGAQVWRIVVQTDKDKRMADELQTKYDAQLWKEVKQEVDYLLKPQVLGDAEKHIRAANLSRTVLIDNLQQVIEVENPPAEEIAQLQNRKGHRLTWQAYHRLEDIHGFVDYMAKTYPDICTVETIGYSVQKRPLKILKISNGNASNPSIWLDGGMHAREWISPATVTYIANQLIEGWEDLPDNMRNINWYLHPVANPDGYEYSHTTDRLWRKNMRSHGRQCPGVDLNRNFGYKWGGKGTSASPCSQTYRGSKAFSEPETFYISKFISSYPRETFQAYLSFHSYGQYILYPWGYDYHLTQDRSDLDRVARQAGTSITKLTGVKYTVGSAATTLYPAAGGSDDWAKGIAGIKYSYTIEMGDTGRYGFVLPAKFIHYNGKDGYTFVETVARAIMPAPQQDRKRTL